MQEMSVAYESLAEDKKFVRRPARGYNLPSFYPCNLSLLKLLYIYNNENQHFRYMITLEAYIKDLRAHGRSYLNTQKALDDLNIYHAA
jgi:hypothetical protein